ncbi:hypothetical protein J437_LFUL010452, partial [Ladona fulva]
MEKFNQRVISNMNNTNPTLGMEIFEQQYERSLDANREKQDVFNKHKEELSRVKSQLETLPNELSYDIMIPIGSQGLMRGKIVHTNEILALIGDNWYVKTTANHARQMCERRIERCKEMIDNLNKELELMTSWRKASQEVFQPPEGGLGEITEEYDEEKEKDWKATHREKVRKHYLELAKLKNKENKTTCDDEEALRRRLDELELQEEMEDELIRSGEDMDNLSSDSDDVPEDQDDAYEKESGSDECPKRRVSFSSVVQKVDIDCEEEKPEPLRIFFHHSEASNGNSEENSEKVKATKSSPCELGSPSDMYSHFSSLFPPKIPPKGILKQTSQSPSTEENDFISEFEIPQPPIVKPSSTPLGFSERIMGDSTIDASSENHSQPESFTMTGLSRSAIEAELHAEDRSESESSSEDEWSICSSDKAMNYMTFRCFKKLTKYLHISDIEEEKLTNVEGFDVLQKAFGDIIVERNPVDNVKDPEEQEVVARP